VLAHSDSVALAIWIVNVNAWGAFPDLLESEPDARILLVEEHRFRDPEARHRASSSCLRLGWKSIWVPGIPGPQDGDSSGVAGLAHDRLGLFEVEGGNVLNGRVLSCMVRAPVSPAFCLSSLYLEHSVGLGAANSQAKLGEFLTNLDSEFVVAGDCSYDPKLRDEDWFKVLDCVGDAKETVARGDGAGAFARLPLMYQLWADQAELALERLLGCELPIHGSRGAPVETDWKRIVKPLKPPEDSMLRGLGWLGSQVCALPAELAALGARDGEFTCVVESLK
ncbi:unnamed protein product, partial [Prorocentrum cordatum]